MRQFQRLVRAALLSGTIAGALLFVYQYVVVVPRIVAAETFEAQGGFAETDAAHRQHSEWKPDNGWERNFFTAASTILTGIGFAALLIAAVTLGGFGLDVRRGLLWGLAGFACFTVAPALGLPPEPPGVPVVDLGARQVWWLLTVIVTAVGLFLTAGNRRRWTIRLGGAILLALPHLIGPPHANGPQVVPASLVRDFAIASIAGNGLFWLVLGTVAGWLFPIEPTTDSGF
jgi:cobalt transporter subunit CbtA